MLPCSAFSVLKRDSVSFIKCSYIRVVKRLFFGDIWYYGIALDDKKWYGSQEFQYIFDDLG
jgi:hypothetical protein